MSRLAWLGALCLLVNGCACHHHFLGVVEDGAKDAAVAGADIGIEGIEGATRSDKNGWFEIAMPCRDEPYVLRIRAAGYEKLSKTLDLDKHEETRRFTLTPASEPAPDSEAETPR